jgi:hypothetical protein
MVADRQPQSEKILECLKTRLKKEESQLATNCSQLKMQAADGKYYLTDVADTEQLLRLEARMSNKSVTPAVLATHCVANYPAADASR